MKINKQVLASFVLLVVIASVYRIMPHGTYGFPPQLAMAVFAGAIIANKKYSFLLPLSSMVLSDLLFQLLYMAGYGDTLGFYDGQWINYLLIGSLTVFGFMARNFKPANIAAASLAAPTAYFLLSNLVVWAGGGGFGRPRTFSGLMQCYTDGLPFYSMQLLSTLVFSFLLFGIYSLFIRSKVALANQPV